MSIVLPLSLIHIYYTIKVDKKMHDDYRSNFLRRFGRLVDTDKVTADEALEVTLDNGDMKIEGAYVGLISMNEEERKPFILSLIHI